MSNQAVKKATLKKAVTVGIDDIKPYWNNPRNNQEAVDSVIASIEAFGYQQPIVVDAKKVIIVGHTRYQALLRLGYEEVDIIIEKDLNPELVKAYRIADNSTGEIATWNNDALTQEVRGLTGVSETLNLDLLMPTFDLEALLGSQFDALKGVTQEQIDKNAEDLASAQAEKNKKEVSELIEVMCPHCAESFSVKRNDILTRPESG